MGTEQCVVVVSLLEFMGLGVDTVSGQEAMSLSSSTELVPRNGGHKESGRALRGREGGIVERELPWCV